MQNYSNIKLSDKVIIETWSYLKDTWTSEPTFNQTISGGDVYNYTLNNVTRYRFVPSPYNAALDGFYTTFTGGVLSGLVVARG